MFTALVWWLLLSLIGVLALPLGSFTLRHLPDRGYAASRVLGVLVVSYVAWLVHYVADFAVAVTAGFVVLAGLSIFFGHKRWGAIAASLRQRAAYIAFLEIFCLAVLMMAMQYKLGTGAIAETEKPADFTMLNSLMQARRMPPHDPWLAGAPISYYYFGYYITGLLARLTSTPPGVAFNIGITLIWVLTALMGFAVGHALTHRRRYGLALAFALTVMGNLDYWFRAPHVYQYGDLREKYVMWPDDPAFAAGGKGVAEYLANPVSHNWDYWHASRVVDATEKERLITEFPAFSFFLGDLHPHVMSLPFFLLALSLSLNLLKAPLPGWGAFGSRLSWQVAQVLLLGVTFGSLGFLNSWDFPTVMLVLAVSLAVREMWALGTGLSVRWFLSFAKVGLPIAFLAFASYLPFYRALQTQLQGIEVVKDRTDLYYWPFLFGGFLIVLVPALVLRARGGSPAKAPAAAKPAVPAAEAGSGSERAKKDKPRKKERRAEPRPQAATGPQCVLCGAPPSGSPVCAKCGGEIVDPRPPAELPDARLRKTVGGLGSFLAGAVSPWGRVLVVLAVALALFDVSMSRRPEDLGKPEVANALESMTYQMDDPAVTVFCGWLVLLAMGALARRNETRELAFAHILAAFGFAILAACEWFYFKDLFSMFPHLARMNTVFKFYIHAWVLLAAAAVPLLAWLLRAVWSRWPMSGCAFSSQSTVRASSGRCVRKCSVPSR